MPSRKNNKYTTAFKLKVIEVAEKKNNCVAAREFCVSEKLVRDWRKISNKLQTMPKQKCANRGKPSKWPQLEKKVAEWVLENRQNGNCVTRGALRIHARKEAKKDGISDFKASAGWCTRFMRRYDLVLRERTKIAQKLPADLDDKILQFHQFVIRNRQKEGYKLSCIGNMDETPITLDMPANRTVNQKGEKTVLIRTTGHEKSRITLVLSCMADCTKLKPMVIFKRKTLPKEKFPKGIVIHVHPQGWMDEGGCRKWIKEVWNLRPGGLRKEKSLLVWDQFRAHLVKNVVDNLRSQNTDIAVIPGGLTSVLQPLDVSINKPFKDMMRIKWNNWMCDGEKTYTKGGSMRAPSLPLICAWIVDSWNEIKADTIVKSFKKCGISNALDGTEDDYLWDNMDEEEVDDVLPLTMDSEDEDDPYDDIIHPDDYDTLFGAEDDEHCDFAGFE